MLKVTFTTEFKRGRLRDLVALLSGRNFETRKFEETFCTYHGIFGFDVRYQGDNLNYNNGSLIEADDSGSIWRE